MGAAGARDQPLWPVLMSEGRGLSLPAQPAEVPGLPSNFQPVNFEEFVSLNTKPVRPALQDGEMFWCNGWMPVAPNTLRVLPGTGPEIFTAPAGTAIVWFNFGNISDTAYCFALLSNGAVYQINVNSHAASVLIPAGTIANPRSDFGFSQWGSQYIIFAA